VLADRLHCNVTIDITNGVYREEVRVFGITVEPGKSLTFLGDESWAPSSPGDPAVRITGKDNDTTGTKVRGNGLYAQQCSNIIVKGILFDNAIYGGVALHEGYYRLYNCKSVHNGHGFVASRNASAYFEGCLAGQNDTNGFHVNTHTHTWLRNCASNNNGLYGIAVNMVGSAHFYGTGEFSNNSKSGMMFIHNSRGWFSGFSPAYTGEVRNNAEYGIEIRYDAYTEDHDRNIFSGNGITNLRIDNGGHTYN